MSVRLPSVEPNDEAYSSSSSSTDDDEDQTWDDWVSDSADKRLCPSLFDDTVLPSVAEALAHDRSKHGFDLDAFCAQLSLDFHKRVRLVNYIRKQKPTPQAILALTGFEECFTSDDYLRPVLEDDPLLQVQSGEWSDDDEPSPADTLTNAQKRIKLLEAKLSKALSDINDYRQLMGERLGISDELNDQAGSSALEKQPSDDDTHYFDSYGENDIHAVMIQDRVRTASYASFIMSTPQLFQDAVVLDVGCGTGILSLFAARAGAKRVIAVDASAIAERAKENVRANQMDNVVTVIRGKVEDISLPDDIEHVDVIVSEWMGYGLLYESMLDSVLRARDRFLKPGGIMAPSQTHMVLGLCEADEIYKERVRFWDDVYGFDMSAMAEGVYGDAIVDVVGPETLISNGHIVKDLQLRDTKPSQLNFSSPFSLTSNSDQRTKVHAFLLYFDTFFTPSGEPVRPGTEVTIVKEGEAILADVWHVGGRRRLSRKESRRKSRGPDTEEEKKEKGKEPVVEEPVPIVEEKVTSFSTGPKSVPTHWKQTLFLLREPITVNEGSVVSGTFHCRKSDGNSRELDVEIHYSVKHDGKESTESIVQMYKVR